MAKDIPKSSNKPIRKPLQNIPDDLFDADPNIGIKVKLVQDQYTRDPLKLALMIKRMLNGQK
jgi:hypothetical protein